jgi:FAM192A/Fyv6, N-terminal domain
MIKGLDDDEVNFLDQVDKSRVEAERRKAAEDKEAMDEYRSAVSSLQEDSVQSRMNIEVIKKPGLSSSSSGTAPKTSQQKLLAGAVKRKSSDVSKSASAGDQNGAKRQHNETGTFLI